MVKDALKAAARGVARIAAAPLVASFWLRAAWTGRDRSLDATDDIVATTPTHLRVLHRILAGGFGGRLGDGRPYKITAFRRERNCFGHSAAAHFM